MTMSRPGPDELDQEHAFLVGLAGVAVGYYRALTDNGFTDRQALTLTARWQDNYLAEVRRARRDREAEQG